MLCPYKLTVLLVAIKLRRSIDRSIGALFGWLSVSSVAAELHYRDFVSWNIITANNQPKTNDRSTQRVHAVNSLHFTVTTSSMP